MSDENINELEMKDLIGDIDKSMKRINAGDIINGKILSVTNDEVLVNIGYMTDGVVAREELSYEKDLSPKDLFTAGDEITVYVMEINDGEGNVALSKIKADSLKVWDTLEDSFKNGTAFEVKVSESVKGGAVALIDGIRAFIPASQLSLNYVEDLSSFVGKTIKVKVIDFDRENKRVVLSAKEIEKAESKVKKDALLASLQKNDKVKGVVSRITDFGAFVDLGGFDGLIHISELSWKKVKHPSEVISVGDNVEVYVLNVDKEKGKISLALKEVNKNPWSEVLSKYKKDEIVEGKVVRLTDFGAFIELEPGIDGLVHISEISEDRVLKPSDLLKEGDKIKVKILEIKEKEQRMSLSIKDAANTVIENVSQYNNDDIVTLGDLFKDKLKDFKF